MKPKYKWISVGEIDYYKDIEEVSFNNGTTVIKFKTGEIIKTNAPVIAMYTMEE